MNIESVVQGRALHLTFEFDDIIHHILNIYAPNDGNERMLFYNKIYDYISLMENREYLSIVGDYNCTVNAKLDRGSKNETHVPSASILANIIKDFHMIDCYRHLYPEHCDYTWCNIRSQARIDRIYVPRYLKTHIVSCYSTVCPLSDHRSVKVILCKPCKNLDYRIGRLTTIYYMMYNMLILLLISGKNGLPKKINIFY